MSFTGALPPVLADALRLYEAPPFATAGEFTTWAESHLRLRFVCCAQPVAADNTGMSVDRVAGTGSWHTIEVKPTAGTVRWLSCDADHHLSVESEHWLWNLAYTAPHRCDTVAIVLDWIGRPLDLARIGWAEAQPSVEALRTLQRAVEYLNAGLSLVEHAEPLAWGLPVWAVQRMQDPGDGLGVRHLRRWEFVEGLLTAAAINIKPFNTVALRGLFDSLTGGVGSAREFVSAHK